MAEHEPGSAQRHRRNFGCPRRILCAHLRLVSVFGFIVRRFSQSLLLCCRFSVGEDVVMAGHESSSTQRRGR